MKTWTSQGETIVVRHVVVVSIIIDDTISDEYRAFSFAVHGHNHTLGIFAYATRKEAEAARADLIAGIEAE